MRRSLPMLVAGFSVMLFLNGCSGMPPSAEQERHIQQNDLVLHKLAPRAFVGVWGMPAYQREEFMQFFVMKDDSLMPRSRLAPGEPPRGWEAGIEAGESLTLLYPDRGWLLVFFEEKLVYKEPLPAEKLHALGKSWQQEDKFRSRLEIPPAR